MNRTHNNGELRIENVGQQVELIGWVAKKRNLGALVFVDLRDRYGITQVIFDESFEERLKEVKNEYILSVQGTVIERSSKIQRFLQVILKFRQVLLQLLTLQN